MQALTLSAVYYSPEALAPVGLATSLRLANSTTLTSCGRQSAGRLDEQTGLC